MLIKKIIPIIGIIILLCIVITIGIDRIIAVFSRIDPLYIFLSFFAFLPIVLLFTYEWHLILKKQNILVSYSYALKNIFIGYFYGFITPGGLGGYMRVLYLKDASGQPIEKCLSNVLILNTIDYISLLSLGAVGAIVLSSTFPYLPVIIATLFFIVIILILVFLRKTTWRRLFKKIVHVKLLTPFKDKFQINIDTFYEDLPRFNDLLIPFFLSLIGWLISFSELYLIAKLFSIEVPYITFILIIAVADLIALLPITVYGLGTREVTLVTLFSIFAISPEKIVSLSLFWFVLVWLFPSIIGAGVTVMENKPRGQPIIKKW